MDIKLKTKICSKCKIEKPISEFHNHKYGMLGVQSYCKECMKSPRTKQLEQIPDGFNLCSKCGKIKPLQEFSLSKTGRLGVTGRCKECLRDYAKQHWKLHKNYNKEQKQSYDREYHRKNFRLEKDKRLFKDYGITLNDYNKMLESQNGVCAICGKEEAIVDKKYNKRRNLAVDHDHQTGKIRGLLCSICNPILGRINEDIKILQSAIDYLQKYKE